MRPCDDRIPNPKSATGRADWPGWFALAWAVAFGLLYAEMLLRSRAPGLLAAIRRQVTGG